MYTHILALVKRVGGATFDFSQRLRSNAVVTPLYGVLRLFQRVVSLRPVKVGALTMRRCYTYTVKGLREIF